jgi:hypothetical protein
MGTRSLTHVIESYKDNGKKKKQTLLTMYRQYDGYPRGHGADLVEFLEGSKDIDRITSQVLKTIILLAIRYKKFKFYKI